MRIRRLAIRNFRNFRDLSVDLHDHAVIVAPNGVGKSNLLHALRLVLDPSLADSLRQLRPEDFWDGVPRPLQKTARVEIVVELTDFENDDAQLASLAEYLVETDPMVARLTYVFRAKGNASEPPLPDEFEFFVFGGDREDNRVGYEVRRRMPMDFFHALRDVEGDLASWRRSPLRPLLDRAWKLVTKVEKDALAKSVDAATELVTDTKPLKDLADTITKALSKHAGDAQATDVQLGIGSREAEALIRIVRLLLDDRKRGIGEASLGLANVLFFTLKLLELGHLVENHERDHTFVAIEEPEAHLHPQLQRQMFRSFLRLRPHLARGKEEPLEALPTTILVTTHSSHLASIAPLRSLVLLRRAQIEVAPQNKGEEPLLVSATIAASTTPAELDSETEKDLERYIEVTRAEMLFARGVILVEGEAEQYLVPAIARLQGVDLDRLGITVCSVGGTHFDSYVRLLRCLDIPFTVITDGDPGSDRRGEDRMYELLKIVLTSEEYEAIGPSDFLRATAEVGLFFGQSTFELDLLRDGRERSISEALRDLATTGAASKRAQAWLHNMNSIDEDQVLKDIRAVGKGRFAQRLASRLPVRRGRDGARMPQGPKYVLDAIDYIVKKVGT